MSTVSRSTADLADPGLPGIDVALDVEAVTRSLESSRGLEPDLLKILGGEIDYVRYKPGTSLIAGCRFDVSGPAGPGEMRGYVKLLRADRFALAWPKVAAIASRSSYARVFHLKPLPLLFHLFPFDRQVKGLRILSDTRKMNHRLRAFTPEGSGASRLLRDVTSLRLVRYKPERRAVSSARAVFRDRASGADTERRVLVKAYADATGERTCRLMVALGGSAVPGFPRLARPLAYDPVHRLLHQEELGGIPLPGVLDLRSATRRTGQALALFHQNAPRLTAERRPLSASIVVDQARDALHVMARLAGDDFSPLSRQLIRSLEQAPPREEPAPLIHADFHHDQVLIDQDIVCFVDFDEARPGDPRFDAGNFIAHLRAAQVEGSWPRQEREEIEEAFLDGYAAAGGRVDSLGWFVAAGLARLAVKPFRTWRPAWQDGSTRLVRMGIEAL